MPDFDKTELVTCAIVASIFIALCSSCEAQQQIVLAWPSISAETQVVPVPMQFPFRVPDGYGGDRLVAVPIHITYSHIDAVGEQSVVSETVYSDYGEQVTGSWALAWHEFGDDPQAWSAHVTAWATYTVPFVYPNAGDQYRWILRRQTAKEKTADQSSAVFVSTSGAWQRVGPY